MLDFLSATFAHYLSSLPAANLGGPGQPSEGKEGKTLNGETEKLTKWPPCRRLAVTGNPSWKNRIKFGV